MIKSDKPIYRLLEARLREADKPLTCVQLMEFNEIRESALDEYGDDVQKATNKLSDAVRLMWVNGLLTRYSAPRDTTSQSRFAYEWAAKSEAPQQVVPLPVRLIGKSVLNITEHPDYVEIEFDKFVVQIRSKT